ncbi:MAG: ABC transporter permease, partial [Gammaproteobacteria bacterium]
MPFQPVVLWTDALLYLLVGLGLLLAWQVRRREHLRAPWRAVARRPLAMAAAVVLGAYALVGLADSLHFRPALPQQGGGPVRYAPEVLSLLDLALGPLRTHAEKTYSAPFATHLYVKETVQAPDGSLRRAYPRLRWGGAHLEDPRRRWADVARRGAL